MMNKTHKTFLLACSGAILEYYDFIIYGMMAIYLSEIFFADNDPKIMYLKTFSILAVGYLARPIGGYLFGIIADIYGRKKSLLFIMSLMTFSTLMMGCIPSYDKMGIFAPIVLTVARILQGISFGAEMPSLTTIIKEYTQNENSGKYYGMVISSTSIGALLASGVVFMLSKYFTHDEIIEYAWRIPFFLGSSLAIVIFWIRNGVEETPDFLKSKNKLLLIKSSKNITWHLCKNYRKEILFGSAITLFFSCLIIFSLYLPVYLKQYYKVSVEDTYLNTTIGILISSIVSPIFGYLFDRINRINRIQIIRLVSIAFIVFMAISLSALKNNIPFSLCFFIIGYQIFISAYSTNVLYVLSEIFPVSIRTTGIGICYNTAYACASLVPMILNITVQENNHLIVILIAWLIIISITLMGIKKNNDTIDLKERIA